MVKDVSIRGRVCEDMMAKNRLCIPGPFGGWSHVPWGACGDYTVCLHEAQPEIKLLAFPIMATAPWRHEGLPVWQISQCLVRNWKPAMQMLLCYPFSSSSWAGEMVPCPAPLQVWRSQAVQEDLLSYSSAGMELAAGLGSGEVQ